jgi:glycosyltransferase involved in cell wall biosynthesis
MLNIIIPNYNSEKTINKTLSSLVAQTNKKFIVTVIDDCSTDNSVDIIESYKKILPIRTILLPENKGVGNARQVGLDSNECDYICFLDSDDMFMPYTVNAYLREMNAGFPEALYSDFISEQNGKEVLLTTI